MASCNSLVLSPPYRSHIAPASSFETVMPAERSKTSSKRSNEVQATQLVWAVDSPASYTSAATPTDCSVSYNDTVTPASFDNITVSPGPTSESVGADDPPPLVDAPITSEFQIYSPNDDNCSTSSRRTPHAKKKPENHIPRPPNAFILFRSSFIKSQHVSAEVETNHSTLSKIIGMTWQSLPEDERQAWHIKARAALAEHRRKFPKYTFRPTQSKVKSKGGGEGKPEAVKRKVREVEPKDLKRCAKIAELLVEGKKGAELDAAIQEFDKHHVPEIVTRFEAPITARAFRRSSSAPIPETENSKKSQSFLPVSPVLNPKDGKRKVPRLMTSIQPTRCSTPRNDEVNEELTAPLKQEPSMDFSAFSFAHMNQQPNPGFECDPMSPVTPIQPPSLTIQINDSYSSPAPLTIPNMPSFLMDDWSQSSSPVSQYAPSDAFGNLSPVDPFDAHFTFDTFETLDLDRQHSTDAFPINKGTGHLPSLDNLSLRQPEYDLSAGAELNLFDMDMANLASGFEATQYLDIMAHSPCSQQQHQQYHHQHQPTFIPPHHFRLLSEHPHQHPHHIPNLDLTTLIGPPAEFAL